MQHQDIELDDLTGFLESGASWNYVVGAPFCALATDWMSLGGAGAVIPANAGLDIALGWNYLDAAYCIYLGTLQLLDEEDYRQTQNTIKGVVNILSGVQLSLLSLGGAPLASLGFAIAMGLDLVTAVIDVLQCMKEVELDGWLEERQQEMEYQQNRISAFTVKMNNLPDNDEEKKNLQDKINTLNAKVNDIQEKVNLRKLVRDTNQASPLDQKIQNELTEKYKQARINLVLKMASFVGMTLLAVSGFVSCPPLIALGMAITLTVAAIYLYRNMDKIVTIMAEYGLFSSKRKTQFNGNNVGVAFAQRR